MPSDSNEQDLAPEISDWRVNENGKPENIYGDELSQYEVVVTKSGNKFLRKK